VAQPVLHIVGMHEQFRKFARRSSDFVGSAEVFLAACVVIGLWAVLGPRFHYSDTWQLVINTTTTIITFLMVFLIQNTQSRDARAIQLKLDELIRAVQGARTGMVRLEELSDEELCALTGDFEKLRQRLAAYGRGPTAVPTPREGEVEAPLDSSARAKESPQ